MKKRLIKILAASMVMLSALTFNTYKAEAAWKEDSTGWWYTEGSSYATGWRNIDSKWHCFDNNGYMFCNTIIDGYLLGPDGAWIEGKYDYNTPFEAGQSMCTEDFLIGKNVTLMDYADAGSSYYASFKWYRSNDSVFKTYRGISLGATLDEVIKQYGISYQYFDLDEIADGSIDSRISALAPKKLIDYHYYENYDSYNIRFCFDDDNRLVFIGFYKNLY